MTKWEYLQVEPHAIWAAGDNSWMNKLGANGWELVSVDNGVAYFRRQKQHPIPVTIGPTEHKEVTNV